MAGSRSDAAIDAYLSRGVPAGAPEPDWSLMPGTGFQSYGGAIADVREDESAFSHRRTLVEYFGGATWNDPSEDAVRMAGARAWAATPAAHAALSASDIFANRMAIEPPSLSVTGTLSE